MDPFLIAIATAAVGKATEEVAEGVVAAVKLVKDRFGKDPERELVLLRAETGRVPVEDLAAAIDQECAADDALRERLGELAGRPIQVTQVNQAGQNVKFQNNFYAGAPANVTQADHIDNLNLG
ncbi:MAG TPA: hypothetical protein VHG10_04330 [Glycomyces sp.]|nr:hypothetical protein [Glycomyces sp.]